MIYTYLTFNGNAREAMTFYQKCLGGELSFQTVGESPMAEKMPQKMKDLVVHATLANGQLLLMATDLVSENGLIKGNSVSLVLSASTKKQLMAWYNKLSVGGQDTYQIQATHWGDLFGSLTDKFGNHWLLHYKQKKTTSNKKTL